MTIRVTDTGIGISDDHHVGLFEKFVQADASVTRRFGGSGLGLAICQQLVAKMGGAIEIESEEGGGSVFTVRLPLLKLRDGEVASQPESALSEPRAECAPPLRILAAEDNPINQLVLKTLLEQFGIEPCIVENGEQALNAWREEPWDLILMDVQMPVMDGVTATRAIRDAEAAGGLARTPILALTANVMAHQTESYLAAGMDDVVAKPIEIRRLIEIIETTLAAAPAERPAGCSAAA